MKNKTLSLNDSLKNFSQKKLFAAWIFYHAAVLIFFLASIIIFRGKIGIDSDLFNLVPKSISMASVKKMAKGQTIIKKAVMRTLR